MTNPPLETFEQQNLVKWLRLKKLFYFSIPNGSVLKGTPLQRARQMNKLKSEGLVDGASDIVVMLKDKILFIELKRAKKTLKSGNLSVSHTKTSDEQLKFLAKVDGFKYTDSSVCYGCAEAIDFIEGWM